MYQIVENCFVGGNQLEATRTFYRKKFGCNTENEIWIKYIENSIDNIYLNMRLMVTTNNLEAYRIFPSDPDERIESEFNAWRCRIETLQRLLKEAPDTIGANIIPIYRDKTE